MRQSAHRGLAVPVVREGQMMMAQTPCATCAVLCQYGPGQCAIAPLRAGETTLGALCVVRDHDKSFDPEQTRSLALLANAAAIAIANARLAATARQEAARSASCAERERLAAELHDHLAQTLSFLNLKADRLQELLAAGFTAESAHELARMKAAIATAYNQVRAALAGLQQPTAVADDLAEKLTACLAEFRTTAGLAADLLVTDPTALALPPVTQIQVLHIVREALTNVRRHAQAQHVCVRIERIDDTACFTVEDDGRGFDPQAIVGDHHLGLAIMRTRAERSGGHFALVSAPGAGTKIVVHLPCGTQSKTA
jgi:two-component system nitrate/nitrite sensor histidine kinase NarX